MLEAALNLQNQSHHWLTKYLGQPNWAITQEGQITQVECDLDLDFDEENSHSSSMLHYLQIKFPLQYCSIQWLLMSFPFISFEMCGKSWIRQVTSPISYFQRVVLFIQFYFDRILKELYFSFNSIQVISNQGQIPQRFESLLKCVFSLKVKLKVDYKEQY